MYRIFTGALFFASLSFLFRKTNPKQQTAKSEKAKKKPTAPKENCIVWTEHGMGFVERILPGEFGKLELEIDFSWGRKTVSKYDVHPIQISSVVRTSFGTGKLISVNSDGICMVKLSFGVIYSHCNGLQPVAPQKKISRKKKERLEQSLPQPIANLLLEAMFASCQSTTKTFITKNKGKEAVVGMASAVVQAVEDQKGPTCGAYSVAIALTAIGIPHEPKTVLCKYYNDFQSICVTKVTSDLKITHTTRHIGNINIQKAVRYACGGCVKVLIDTKEARNEEKTWKLISQSIQKPKTALLFHTTNHYVTIAGYLQFGEKRFIISSRRGQRPTTLISLQEVCEIITKYKGYKIMKIFQ